jgi:nucleoside-diphosphate-sugar epimerase
MTKICSTALVTGGAGFIGSHLVDRLVAEGCRVAVLDNLSAGTLDNLAGVKTRIRFIEGDILDQDCLTKAVRGCEVVFHLAARVSVPYSVQHPVGSARINELGTLRVLDTARREGSGRVVFSSSSAVYGDRYVCPLSEDRDPAVCSPYALQKLTGERYADLFHQLYGLETVSLRYFNVYGPRQDPGSPYSGVISIFWKRPWPASGRRFSAMENNTGILSLWGMSCRPTWRRHAIPAYRKRYSISEPGGGPRSTSSGNMYSSSPERNSRPVYADPREGDIRESLADTRRAAAQLEFRSETPFLKGLETTCEWYRRKAAG